MHDIKDIEVEPFIRKKYKKKYNCVVLFLVFTIISLLIMNIIILISLKKIDTYFRQNDINVYLGKVEKIVDYVCENYQICN